MKATFLDKLRDFRALVSVIFGPGGGGGPKQNMASDKKGIKPNTLKLQNQ